MSPRTCKPRICRLLRRPGAYSYVAPAAGLEPPGCAPCACAKGRGVPERRASGPALLGGASGPRSGPP
jgi:hypothetical protein